MSPLSRPRLGCEVGVEGMLARVRITRVISGGQTGADRAALDVALAVGLPYGGWCPAGGWAEDHPCPPGLLADYPLLRAAPPGPSSTRTRWNVRDSDATLVLVVSGLDVSPGTRLTVEVATELGRPCTIASARSVETISSWLRSLADPLVLNVAGPRESEEPGLYDAAYQTLTRLFG